MPLNLTFICAGDVIKIYGGKAYSATRNMVDEVWVKKTIFDRLSC